MSTLSKTKLRLSTKTSQKTRPPQQVNVFYIFLPLSVFLQSFNCQLGPNIFIVVNVVRCGLVTMKLPYKIFWIICLRFRTNFWKYELNGILTIRSSVLLHVIRVSLNSFDTFFSISCSGPLCIFKSNECAMLAIPVWLRSRIVCSFLFCKQSCILSSAWKWDPDIYFYYIDTDQIPGFLLLLKKSYFHRAQWRY